MDINVPEKTYGYLGEGLRGPAWTIAGVAISGVVVETLKALFNGGIGQRQDFATQRDLAYERQLTEANAKSAALEAKLDCRAEILASERRYEDKFDAIEKQLCDQRVHNAVNDGAVAGIAEQTRQLLAMTSRFIAQPIMAASEAALTIGPFAKTAAATGTGTGG